MEIHLTDLGIASSRCPAALAEILLVVEDSQGVGSGHISYQGSSNAVARTALVSQGHARDSCFVLTSNSHYAFVCA